MIGTRIYSGAPFEAMAGYARAVVDPPMCSCPAPPDSTPKP